MHDITSKFTDNLKDVLGRALSFVAQYGTGTIEPIHLLWAMCEQPGSAGGVLMQRFDITGESFEGFLDKTPNHRKFLIPGLSAESRDVIERAVLIASKEQHELVGTEHLMIAVLERDFSSVVAFLKHHGVTGKQLLDDAYSVMEALGRSTDDLAIQLTSAGPSKKSASKRQRGGKVDTDEEDDDDLDEKESALDFFTKELTTKTAVAHFTPVVGREQETARLIHILARKTKNNPILLGHPGVGKTALVEGLAQKIVSGDAPDLLKDMKIHQLDLASLLAGTMYRGEFESRMRQLIDEVEERDDVILFIDEIHMIMGTGATSGSLDAANMLKPALARGTIRCIGATTSAEYKKFIEVDGALDRRFQAIFVDEPSKSETRTILQGLLSHYERHHHVRYDDSAIDSAIELADHYFTGRYYPDKAIDVLDEAGAQKSSLKKRGIPAKEARLIERLQKRLDKLSKGIANIEDEESKDALLDQRDALQKEINSLKRKQVLGAKSIVKRADIETAVAHMKHIPVRTIREHKKLLANLERELKKHVFGQDGVIQTIAHAIKRGRLGIGNRKKPLASFLFVGASGVGKTHLAQSLATILSPEKQAFLRLDMSEFSERFHASKLIGSPAGYVGYRDSTALTDFVKHHPQSVLLFDEAEKAHPDVLNLFLQILDNGHLTDSAGNTIDFRNTIMIFTSNALSASANVLGFTDTLLQVMDAKPRLKERFAGELLNRLDHICVFSDLSEDAKRSIASKHIEELRAQLKQQGVSTTVSRAIADLITKRMQSSSSARDIKRAIETELEEKIIEHLLNAQSVKELRVLEKNGAIAVE